jgi:hypothetical protein
MVKTGGKTLHFDERDDSDMDVGLLGISQFKQNAARQAPIYNFRNRSLHIDGIQSVEIHIG